MIFFSRYLDNGFWSSSKNIWTMILDLLIQIFGKWFWIFLSRYFGNDLLFNFQAIGTIFQLDSKDFWTFNHHNKFDWNALKFQSYCFVGFAFRIQRTDPPKFPGNQKDPWPETSQIVSGLPLLNNCGSLPRSPCFVRGLWNKY